MELHEILEFLRKILRNFKTLRSEKSITWPVFDGPKKASILSAQLESTLKSRVPVSNRMEFFVCDGFQGIRVNQAWSRLVDR